ncbi:hypothetical protein GCM10009834_25150 [Streptomonospora arabica]
MAVAQRLQLRHDEDGTVTLAAPAPDVIALPPDALARGGDYLSVEDGYLVVCGHARYRPSSHARLDLIVYERVA